MQIELLKQLRGTDRADLNDPWHYIWVVFSGASAPHLLRACGLSKTNIVYHPKDTTIQTSQNIRQPLMNILEHPDASEAAVMGNFYLFLDQLIQNAAHPIIESSNKGMFRQHYVNLACQYVSTYYATMQEKGVSTLVSVNLIENQLDE